MSTQPDIWSTFAGKNWFLSGSSGFVGKCLLYKMLKEFPDTGTITLLMRPKKGKKPHERIGGELLSSPAFDGLKEALGAAEWKRRTSKLRVAVGDVMHEGLGLSAEDTAFLTSTTHIILHVAATVNFQEKLPVSVQMNVLGTLRMLSLAKKCPQLEAMVHTSTCYVNWNRHGSNLVRETVYPLPFDPEQMCRFILGMQESEVPKMTALLLKKYRFPNTYTFTKNMAEQLVQKFRGNVPISIVRPSIVGCSLREPYPGWVDVLTAAGGILFTTGLGVLHELHADPNLIADIVPVDLVVNTLLKAAYKTAISGRLAKATGSAISESSALNSKNLARAAAAQAGGDPANRRIVAQALAAARASKGASPSAGGAVPPPPKTNGNGNGGSDGEQSDAKPYNVDKIKISTFADSTSGTIRPSSGNAAAAKSNRHHHHQHQQAAAAGGDNATAPILPNSSANSVFGGSNSPSSDSSQLGGNSVMVFQAATSSMINPLTWASCREATMGYWRMHPPPRAIDKAYVSLYPNEQVYKMVFFFVRQIPFEFMKLAAALPGVMTPKQQQLVKKYARVIFRAKDLNFQFKPFTTVEWRYDQRNSPKHLDDGMSSKARSAFTTDLYDINWPQYVESYCYGLVRYFMKVRDSRPVPKMPTSSNNKFLQSML